MIRKIQNHKAWVLKLEDVSILYKTSNICSWYFMLNLPLFDTHVYKNLTFLNHKTSDYIVVIDVYEFLGLDTALHMSENLLNEINKTWNKFYEG